MWSPLMPPGQLTLVHARTGLADFLQELAHETIHATAEGSSDLRAGRPVLWCDGAHAFHPDLFAELNLTRGHAADDGADRLLVKRCMTAFQWDSTLTQHLDAKLADTGASLVVVHPFNTLWTHEEIQDWEQEDYTRFSLAHLKDLARDFDVPVVLGAEMARWWKSHPVLAGATYAAADARWEAMAVEGRWKAVRHDGHVLDPLLRAQVTLLDYLEEAERAPVAVPVPHPRRKARAEEAAPGRPFRTRIVHRDT